MAMGMGDTACLMHAFSYTCTSGLSNEPKQGNGNPTNALGESVSFGRFVSESLSWEKWSAFSHNNNRYVEEAERYSQPGSVAQKKAFFEAHYKRIAAAKKAAAALLEEEEEEEASAANNNATETPPAPADGTSIDTQSQASDSYAAALHQPQEHGQEPDLQSGSMKEAETPLEIIVKEDEMHTGLEVSSGTPKVEKPQLSVRVHPKKQASNSTKSFDIQDDTSASENSGTPQIEKPLLKISASSRDAPPSVNSKKKSAFSSFKSSIYPKTSKIPSPSPAKIVPSRIKKEQKTIPIANKSTLQYTEKKQSKKPLFAYTDSTTPARTPERLFAPSNAKTPNTRVGSAAYRAFQACMSPLRTPNTAASARMSKNVSTTTPQPDNTRINPPKDGSRTATPKWKILSAVCSKSLAANRNKLQSPTVSTPFTLRTEERAARRKQKLEEKFNLKETPKDQLQTKIKTPKVQLQTKIKEKAENELRKLRRSFCFNARPPPNFSKQRRETTENHNMKKGTTTQAQSSSKLGKKLSSNGPSISYGPSTMNKSYNKPINTSSSPATTTSHFISSSAGATNHENTSPNIRYY